MDTMLATKITAALCTAMLVYLLGSWAADEMYSMGHHGDDHHQAYSIEVESNDEADVAEGPTFEELYATADVGKGERVFGKCRACHKLEQGANGTGPYLYGLVGRDVAAAEGYGFSGSLVAVADVWTPENLDGFLESPRSYAPGTSMGFAGLPKAEDRANLIAYLATIGG